MSAHHLQDERPLMAVNKEVRNQVYQFRHVRHSSQPSQTCG